MPSRMCECLRECAGLRRSSAQEKNPRIYLLARIYIRVAM